MATNNNLVIVCDGMEPVEDMANASHAWTRCPTCGCTVDTDGFCEDCAMSDCRYCGMTTLRWMLSENLACDICEEVA